MRPESDENLRNWSKFAKAYDPIKCASIDGTDCEPHDRAVVRALNSTYKPNRFVKGRPECTIFVSRLNHETSKDTMKEIFSKYGKLKRFRMVKDIVTGMPKGYAFVEYEEEQAAEEAYMHANRMVVDGNAIFVDFECERLLKGWKPRRLGGGFAGKKESGQLRFGGRDRPFKKPIALELKEQEEKKHDVRLREEHQRRRSRERHRKRTPPKENGATTNDKKAKKVEPSKSINKRALSPKGLEEKSSPPHKIARRQSPSKLSPHHAKKRSSSKDKNVDKTSKQKASKSPSIRQKSTETKERFSNKMQPKPRRKSPPPKAQIIHRKSPDRRQRHRENKTHHRRSPPQSRYNRPPSPTELPPPENALQSFKYRNRGRSPPPRRVLRKSRSPLPNIRRATTRRSPLSDRRYASELSPRPLQTHDHFDRQDELQHRTGYRGRSPSPAYDHYNHQQPQNVSEHFGFQNNQYAYSQTYSSSVDFRQPPPSFAPSADYTTTQNGGYANFYPAEQYHYNNEEQSRNFANSRGIHDGNRLPESYRPAREGFRPF